MITWHITYSQVAVVTSWPAMIIFSLMILGTDDASFQYLAMLPLYIIVSICVDDHSTFSISIPISQSVRCEGSEKNKKHIMWGCVKRPKIPIGILSKSIMSPCPTLPDLFHSTKIHPNPSLSPTSTENSNQCIFYLQNPSFPCEKKKLFQSKLNIQEVNLRRRSNLVGGFNPSQKY